MVFLRVSLYPPALIPAPPSSTLHSPIHLLWPATAPDGDHAGSRYVVGAGFDGLEHIVVGHFKRGWSAATLYYLPIAPPPTIVCSRNSQRAGKLPLLVLPLISPHRYCIVAKHFMSRQTAATFIPTIANTERDARCRKQRSLSPPFLPIPL